MIDLNALRSEVDRKDAERPAAVRQWDKLPVGTRVSAMRGGKRLTDVVADCPAGGYLGFAGPLYGDWHIEELQAADAQIAPSEFANTYKRDTLAKLGFFSVDQPAHRAKRRQEAFEEAKREAAATSLGINRGALLDRVAAEIESRLTSGIWARSTAEYYKKREALDNAILYAAGVNDHA